jgi:hypothetical protein
MDGVLPHAMNKKASLLCTSNLVLKIKMPPSMMMPLY